jgi:predicted nucleotidyltransferase
MKIRDGLEVDERRLAEICRRYGVVRLDLFGSALHDDFTDDSDIDLLYELRPDARLGWEIVDMQRELEELFGRKVDLVGRQSIHWYIRDDVLAEARLLHAA